MITLENEYLEVKIKEEGAELVHLIEKKSKVEYIWSGDEAYWGRHAPILFPIVGKVVDNSYRIGSESYQLGQHGFARDLTFSIKEQASDCVSLSLTSNEQTLLHYPYSFVLTVSYTLIECSLVVAYQVDNKADTTMYFNIGAHPGFRCPLNEDEAFFDYCFQFEKEETLNRILLNSEGLLLRNLQPFLEGERSIPLTKELFCDDALVFTNLNSDKIKLFNEKTGHGVEVHFPDFPFLGLWSKPSGAPFVCIEPWFGHADYADFTDDFRNKEDIQKLEAQESFSCHYQISIL